MARCKRCNSFMFVNSDTGYCKKCNAEVLKEMMEKEEARRKAEEEARRKAEEEKQRLAAEKVRCEAVETTRKNEERTQKVNAEAESKKAISRSEMQKAIRKEFAETFPMAKMYFKGINPNGFDTDYNHLLQPAIDLKRQLKFDEANHTFCQVIQTNRVFTPSIARSWFKTLASSGDLTDAIAIANFAIEKMPRGWVQATFMEDRENLVKPILQNKVPELLDFIVAMSGNGSYTIKETDLWFSIDEYANAIIANSKRLVDVTVANYHQNKTKDLGGGLVATYIPINFEKIQTLSNVFQPSSKSTNWIKPIGSLTMTNPSGTLEVYVCLTKMPGKQEDGVVFVSKGGKMVGEGIQLCLHCLSQLNVSFD